MPKIEQWKNDDKTKLRLSKLLQNAQDYRKPFEKKWQLAERILMNTKGSTNFEDDTSISYSSQAELAQFNEDETVGINYTFKNARFIHSQLSANPPSVVARPTSNDSADRRRADAADRVNRWALRQYKLQEWQDSLTWDVLYYGNGWLKCQWNPELGEIVEVDDEGVTTQEGDIQVRNPSVWDVFIDPDATFVDDLRHIFERMYISWDEFIFQWPEYEELAESFRIDELDTGGQAANKTSRTTLRQKKYDVVEVYQYWEKGLPLNGMQGRFCFMLPDGQPLGNVESNPHIFQPAVRDGEPPRPGIAELPYILLTDIDIPQTVYGKAIVDYEAPIQEVHNKMVNVMLDNLRAHGVARLILPEGAEIADDSISNSPWDVIKITGGNGVMPTFAQPMPFPTSFSQMMDQMRNGINDSAGVNDAMFGEMKRETSGFSMQYATNQGNMIRRRLFNKYVLSVELLYKTILKLVIKHWDTPRSIKVLGEEKAWTTFDLQSADISGGYDLVVEYGASLSLDPTTRREEILTLLPLLKEAGMETREILGFLKLKELGNALDDIGMARDRQYEIFKEMSETKLYIEPEELEDHVHMLSYALQYRMTGEFKYLEEDVKTLVETHIKAREELAAKEATPDAAAPEAAGANPLAMLGGLPPMPTS